MVHGYAVHTHGCCHRTFTRSTHVTFTLHVLYAVVPPPVTFTHGLRLHGLRCHRTFTGCLYTHRLPVCHPVYTAFAHIRSAGSVWFALVYPLRLLVTHGSVTAVTVTFCLAGCAPLHTQFWLRVPFGCATRIYRCGYLHTLPHTVYNTYRLPLQFPFCGCSTVLLHGWVTLRSSFVHTVTHTAATPRAYPVLVPGLHCLFTRGLFRRYISPRLHTLRTYTRFWHIYYSSCLTTGFITRVTFPRYRLVHRYGRLRSLPLVPVLPAVTGSTLPLPCYGYRLLRLRACRLRSTTTTPRGSTLPLPYGYRLCSSRFTAFFAVLTRLPFTYLVTVAPHAVGSYTRLRCRYAHTCSGLHVWLRLLRSCGLRYRTFTFYTCFTVILVATRFLPHLRLPATVRILPHAVTVRTRLRLPLPLRGCTDCTVYRFTACRGYFAFTTHVLVTFFVRVVYRCHTTAHRCRLRPAPYMHACRSAVGSAVALAGCCLRLRLHCRYRCRSVLRAGLRLRFRFPAVVTFIPLVYLLRCTHGFTCLPRLYGYGCRLPIPDYRLVCLVTRIHVTFGYAGWLRSVPLPFTRLPFCWLVHWLLPLRGYVRLRVYRFAGLDALLRLCSYTLPLVLVLPFCGYTFVDSAVGWFRLCLPPPRLPLRVTHCLRSPAVCLPLPRTPAVACRCRFGLRLPRFTLWFCTRPSPPRYLRTVACTVTHGYADTYALPHCGYLVRGYGYCSSHVLVTFTVCLTLRLDYTIHVGLVRVHSLLRLPLPSGSGLPRCGCSPACGSATFCGSPFYVTVAVCLRFVRVFAHGSVYVPYRLRFTLHGLRYWFPHTTACGLLPRIWIPLPTVLFALVGCPYHHGYYRLRVWFCTCRCPTTRGYTAVTVAGYVIHAYRTHSCLPVTTCSSHVLLHHTAWFLHSRLQFPRTLRVLATCGYVVARSFGLVLGSALVAVHGYSYLRLDAVYVTCGLRYAYARLPVAVRWILPAPVLVRFHCHCSSAVHLRITRLPPRLLQFLRTPHCRSLRRIVLTPFGCAVLLHVACRLPATLFATRYLPFTVAVHVHHCTGYTPAARTHTPPHHTAAHTTYYYVYGSHTRLHCTYTGYFGLYTCRCVYRAYTAVRVCLRRLLRYAVYAHTVARTLRLRLRLVYVACARALRFVYTLLPVTFCRTRLRVHWVRCWFAHAHCRTRLPFTRLRTFHITLVVAAHDRLCTTHCYTVPYGYSAFWVVGSTPVMDYVPGSGSQLLPVLRGSYGCCIRGSVQLRFYYYLPVMQFTCTCSRWVTPAWLPCRWFAVTVTPPWFGWITTHLRCLPRLVAIPAARITLHFTTTGSHGSHTAVPSCRSFAFHTRFCGLVTLLPPLPPTFTHTFAFFWFCVCVRWFAHARSTRSFATAARIPLRRLHGFVLHSPATHIRNTARAHTAVLTAVTWFYCAAATAPFTFSAGSAPTHATLVYTGGWFCVHAFTRRTAPPFCGCTRARSAVALRHFTRTFAMVLVCSPT